MCRNETGYSKYCSFKKWFLNSYLENAVKSAMKWEAVNNEIITKHQILTFLCCTKRGSSGENSYKET